MMIIGDVRDVAKRERATGVLLRAFPEKGDVATFKENKRARSPYSLDEIRKFGGEYWIRSAPHGSSRWKSMEMAFIRKWTPNRLLLIMIYLPQS